MKTYPKTTCRTCGDRRSTNGMAKHAHNMKHVREGRLVKVETRVGGHAATTFVTPEAAERLVARFDTTFGDTIEVVATAETEAAKRAAKARR